MMGYGAGLGFGFGGWLWMIGMMLLVVGIIVLVVWVAGRALSGTQGGAAAPPTAGYAAPALPPTPDPVEVLRMRFARGEITQDEFLAAKQVLEASR